jgi:hypothetical protein
MAVKKHSTDPRRAALRAPLLLLALSLAAACGSSAAGGDDAVPTADSAVAARHDEAAATGTDGAALADAEAAATNVPAGPGADLPPNEMGEFLVLEYHRLGEKEGEWVRKPENFRKDLQALYERGYRPITMRQMVEGDIDLPAGTTPVVFTMDDSSLGQFYYLPDGKIDPNTMVGMWAAFQQQNPAWHYGAVWCVLPAADYPSNFFGEKPSREVPRAEREATIKQKVDYLVENRHEICNHTLYHARLDRAKDDAQVQEWIGRGEDSIRVYLPEGYDVVTFALPLGMWPKNRSLAWKGSYNGRPYEYEAVLEVSGGPNKSPFDARFDPHSVNRFIVAPGALERQLDAYEKNPGRRYVSDGNPKVVSVPARMQGNVDRARLGGRELRVVPDAAPADSTNAGA